MKTNPRRLGPIVAATAAAVLFTVGCQDAEPTGPNGTGPAEPGRAATAAAPAGAAASLAADDLERALLTEFRSATAMVGPRSGPFADLAAMAGGSSDPDLETDQPECLAALQAFDPDRLDGAASALVSLAQLPEFVVAELLVTATEAAATPLLVDGPPATCREYAYTYGGDEVRAEIVDVTVPAFGRAARGFMIKETYLDLGLDSRSLVLVFQADGYAGSLSMHGGAADTALFMEYAEAAVAQAERVLGGAAAGD